jgi:hypothetical protein
MPTRGASPLHAFAGLWWGVSLQHRPVQSSGMMRRTFFSLFDHRPACVLFPGGGVQRRLRSSSRRCCSFVRYDAIVSFLLSERLCMLRLYAHVGYSWGSVTMTRFTSFVPITLSLSMCRGSFCINCNRFQKDPYVFPQIHGANFYSKEISALIT